MMQDCVQNPVAGRLVEIVVDRSPGAELHREVTRNSSAINYQSDGTRAIKLHPNRSVGGEARTDSSLCDGAENLQKQLSDFL